MTTENKQHPAFDHLAKARELEGAGNFVAAQDETKQAIKEMRAAARANIQPSAEGGTTMDTENTETYPAYLIRVREAAGFATRPEAIRAAAGEDAALYKIWTSRLWS